MEYNDEIVTKIDFEYVKNHSFGGHKYDVVMDRNGFGLRRKRRYRDGHAYMLVYVKDSEFKKLVQLDNK